MKYFTSKEIAEIFDISPGVARKRIRNGEFGTPIFDGWQYLVDETGIKHYQQSHMGFRNKKTVMHFRNASSSHTSVPQKL